MKQSLIAAFAVLLSTTAVDAAAQNVAPAIYTDPAPDKDYPAAMEVVHIPSGGVAINGVAYVAAGAGPHPAVVLCHGLPGNEKNLDLAQAMRRAGWTVITFNYRGSWGSPGNFRLGQNLEDADAVLAFARDPANVSKLRIDSNRLVIMGHSMGGWVTALTAAHDQRLIGAAMVSAANMGTVGTLPREQAIAVMRNAGEEALAGSSPEILADEVIANKDRFDFRLAAAQLAKRRLLILSSDDGLAPATDALAAAVRGAGGTTLTTIHVATDHSWSDNRIRLESEILSWLATLE